MAITEKQREARAEGVGASECAAILGLSPFASAYDVWLEKTGKVVREESEQTEAMEIGNAIEPTTAALAEKRLGCKLVKPTGTYKAENGVMFANLDRQIDKAARGFPICELKSTWITDGWGEPGTDEVPEAVMIQVHAQMLCSDARVAHVARMLGRFGFSVSLFRVPFNAELARLIEDRVCDFWQRNVEKDIPPADSLPSPEMVSRVPRVTGKVAPIEDRLIVAFAGARDLRLQAEKIEEEARTKLLTAMGDAEVGQGSAMLAQFKEVSQRKLDASALKAAHPAIVAEFTRTTSYRKLTTKEIN